MPQEQQPEFEVKDRRRFSADGALREQAENKPEPAPASAGKSAAAPPPPPSPPPASRPAAKAQSAPPAPSAASEQAARHYAGTGLGFEKLGFDRIVMLHYQTAMMQLGLLAVDPSQPLEPDVYGARETIDMLGVLQEKTRGNLTPEEDHLLDKALYDLRMAWVEVNRRYARTK